MPWDQLYRPLEKDEIILETDDVYDDSKREWIRTPNCAGKPAPDRLYTSHRQYRRLRTHDELVKYYHELMALIDAGPTEFSGPEYMEFLYDTSMYISRAILRVNTEAAEEAAKPYARGVHPRVAAIKAGLSGYGEWDDIPDTPEQRALIAAHNADIRARFPNMVEVKP